MATIKDLIKYYLDCLSKDFDQGFGEFARDNKGWGLKYGQLYSLPFINNKNSIYNTPDINKVISRISKDNKSSLYLGYPIYFNVFTARSGVQYQRLVPIFLFKYDATTITTAGNPILENSTPTLNPESIKQITGLSFNALKDEIYSLYENIKYDNYVPHTDFFELINNLKSVRNFWNWIDDLKPEALNQTPLSTLDTPGIYNCAALFAIPKSKYTEGLDIELRELLRKLNTVGDDSIKGSALYDWFYNSIPNKELKDKLLLEPLILNDEQRTAVKKALQYPLTIIEGPPGTGKSQVVTSIILNALISKQSIFFSSKTNNAVKVVLERTNGVANSEILIKLGGENQFGNLQRFFSQINNITIDPSDRSKFNDIKIKYNQTLEEFNEILSEENKMVNVRNECDKYEKEIEILRDKLGESIINEIKHKDYNFLDSIRKEIDVVISNIETVDRRKFTFSQRIKWIFTKNKQIANAKNNYNKLIQLSKSLYYQMNNISLSVDNYELIEQEIYKFKSHLEKIKKIYLYFKNLNELSNYSFQDAAKIINDVENRINLISNEYINLWLKLKYDNINENERSEIYNFVTTLGLIVGNNNNVDKGVWRKYFNLFDSLKKYIPSITVTSLSINKKIPLQKAFFDILVIDEASACDIASVIPLLYRTKNVVIIGDSNQLTHITNMNNTEDSRLLTNNNLTNTHINWSYSVNSILNLALSLNNSALSKVRLLNHHRSHSSIINYCNINFYQQNLRILTKHDSLKYYGKNNIVRWIDIIGNAVRPSTGGAFNVAEINEVINELKRLKTNNYEGSIGVVTPFNHQVNRIDDLIKSDGQLNSWLTTRDFLCDTAHGFQGDERDLIIFSTVISNNSDSRTIGFLNSTGNLFNVAISRAKAALIIIGDKNACLNSKIGYLVNFVNYYDDLMNGISNDRRYDNIKIKQSEWEDIFYNKLFENNIKSERQKNIDNYFLDFAIESTNGKKLNVEIDGEYYHRDWNNELALRDRLRNKRLIELGWDIKRFWVYQVRDNLDWCIAQVQKWINQNE